MKALLNHWNEDPKTYRRVVTEVVTLEGSEEEVFKLFDKMNNRLRYCRECYSFVDKSLEEKYIEWYKSLDESTKFDMFYGNGVVD